MFKMILNSIKILFVIGHILVCLGSPLTVGENNKIIEDIKFLSQSTDDGIKPSRLRILLLDDLNRALISTLPEVNNSDTDVDLKVTTKNCTCINYSCDRLINYGKRLRIQRNCEDYCCRKKFIVKKFAYDEDLETDNGCKISKLETPDTFLLPWTVQIISSLTENNNNQICLGSLIHQQIVLTTLNCAKALIQNNNNEHFQIRFKEKITKYQSRYHLRNITKTITPENYSELYAQFGFNAALLVLDKPIESNTAIEKACISKKSPFNNYNNNGNVPQKCFVDSIEKRNGRYVEVRIPIKLYSPEQCESIYQNSVELFYPKVNVCAGNKIELGVDVTSDGAPLICFTDISDGYYRYIQYGQLIYSSSSSTSSSTSLNIANNYNNNKLPFIFTNISYFKNWIDKNINNLGL